MHILNIQSKSGIMAERGAFEDERDTIRSLAKADSITILKQRDLAAGKIQSKPVAQFPTRFFQL